MIAIYVRVSTAEQKMHGYSVGEQVDRLTSFAHALGYDKPLIYNDAGYSGATMDRPALSMLISDVKAKKIEKVLVYKLDRLSRSQKDTLTLIEDIFLRNGCDFVSISENFDTSTPLGRAMIGILAVFAQLEREQIKERMSMGREARAKQGKYTGSHRHPIGYDYIDGELIPNEYESDLIRRVFTEYSTGKSSRRIGNELNEEGLYHKYGKWLPEFVTRLIESKTYIGYVKYSGEWFKGNHEPIIDDELWEKCQKVHQRRLIEEHHGSGGVPTSYLGGLCTCKRCGAKYIKYHRQTIKRGKKYEYDYYSCFNRSPKTGPGTCKNDTWRMEELDELIFNEIRKLKFSSVTPSKMPNKVGSIDKRINELNKQLERIMTLYTLGEMPLDIIQKKVHEINTQKQKLEAVEIDVRTTPAEAKEIVSSFDDLLEHGSLEDVREAIKTLIDKIEIDGENVYIYWAFD